MASGGHRRVRTRVICSSALTRCAGSKSCHTRAWSRSSRRGAVAELRGDVLRRLALVDEQRGEARAQVSRSDSPGAVLVAGGRPRGAPRRPESALAPVVPVVIGPRLAANDSGSPGASEGRGGVVMRDRIQRCRNGSLRAVFVPGPVPLVFPDDLLGSIDSDRAKQIRKPSWGLEPQTPSLPSKFSHAEKWRLPGHLPGTTLAEMSTNSGC
jgi:hypothetical protein